MTRNQNIIRQTFTLRKTERLKSRKIINRLFREGKSFSHFPLRVSYLDNTGDAANLRVAFSVSNRNFKKAVDRNRIKRLMREAYRLQKNYLQAILAEKQKSISIFILYTDKKLPLFEDMMEKMNGALNQLAGLFS